jgi:peptidoglycan/xylan/chitin deacetylase (PgdA/CDA1 family)
MSTREPRRVHAQQARARTFQVAAGRIGAMVSLISVATVAAVIVLDSASPTHPAAPVATAPPSPRPAATSTSRTTAPGGTASVPILVYHVINPQPAASSASPALYVPPDEFSSHMQALKAAGWHAVTLNQLAAYWTRGVPLGPGKPIVLTFDNGYASQYANALPVLRNLGWVGVEDLQLTGLPPSEGGLTDTQIRGLISAGWELDTQGISHTDLTTVDPAQLTNETATARQMLSSRYGVPVNWFSYPSGDYNPSVIAAVRAAGYLGATTVNPGWASPGEDRFVLPRLVVMSGTTPSQLLAQIASAQSSTSVPATYTGVGVA